MFANRRQAVRLGALLAVAAIVGTMRPAFADARDVSIGGVYICTITHDANGHTSYERAVLANQQITNVLSTPAFWRGGTVIVRQVGPAATVSVGNILVFTITPADVSPTNETPLALAKTWAQRLAQGLSIAMPGSEFHF
jgi:hypothetical protein